MRLDWSGPGNNRPPPRRAVAWMHMRRLSLLPFWRGEPFATGRFSRDTLVLDELARKHQLRDGTRPPSDFPTGETWSAYLRGNGGYQTNARDYPSQTDANGLSIEPGARPNGARAVA